MNDYTEEDDRKMVDLREPFSRRSRQQEAQVGEVCHGDQDSETLPDLEKKTMALHYNQTARDVISDVASVKVQDEAEEGLINIAVARPTGHCAESGREQPKASVRPNAEPADESSPEPTRLDRLLPVAPEGIPGAYRIAGVDFMAFQSINVLREEESKEEADTEEQIARVAGDNDVVALEVDDETPTQVATPVSEDNKPRPLKYYRAVTCIAMVAIVGMVCGSVGAGLLRRSGEVVASTSYRHAQAGRFREQIEKAVGKNYFQGTSRGPHDKALQWIVLEDPLRLEPDAENLLQRFALATFYFATTQQRLWTYCNPPEENQRNTCFAPMLSSGSRADEVVGIRWLTALPNANG